MRQQEIFGFGCLDKIKVIISKLRSRKIFLVTGGNSYKSSGAKQRTEKLLNGLDITIFCDFEVNPKLEDIKKGIEVFKRSKPDLVIAIGGGSVIDVAKAINSLSANHGNPVDYIKGNLKIDKPGKTLIAIPTTSGSGSEATHFAVVYVGKTKYSLAHEYILPQYSIIDPHLTTNLSSKLTATSGMDALAQAIEAYWSINSTPLSKRYSKQAINLATKFLEPAVNNPTSESRIAMSKAAHLAGKSINIAKTTACHAISYPITTYFGIPHGHAVSLTLSSMLKYNADVTKADVNDKRGVAYVKRTVKGINLTSEDINKLIKSIGLETRLSELNINSEQDLDLIIKNGFNPDRVKNNPRLLTRELLRQILIQLV